MATAEGQIESAEKEMALAKTRVDATDTQARKLLKTARQLIDYAAERDAQGRLTNSPLVIRELTTQAQAVIRQAVTPH